MAVKELTFSGMLAKMNAASLEAIHQYFKSDKSKLNIKLRKAVEMGNDVKELQTLEALIKETLEKAGEMMHDAIIVECSENGELDTALIVKKIEIAAAVLTAKGGK